MTFSRIHKNIVHYLKRRQNYYSIDIDEINETNLRFAFAASIAAMIFSIAFQIIAPKILYSQAWSPSFYHENAVIAFAILALITGLAHRKEKTSFSPVLTVITQVIILGTVISIDVFGSTLTTGSFTAAVCIALPVLFILRVRTQLLILLIAGVLYVLLVINVKDPLLGELDIFRIIFGITTGLFIRETIMTYRVKAFEASVINWDLGHRDELSGLYNKRGAFELIYERIKKRDGKLSCVLAVVDIDEFKTINDQLGHLMGDVFIRRVGETLSKSISENDIIGRFGGDEFIIFMEDASETQLKHVFKSCEKKLSTAVYKETGWTISCSVGAVVSVDQKVDLIAAFNQADKALYASKAAGKKHITIVPYQTETELLNNQDTEALAIGDYLVHFFKQNETVNKTHNALRNLLSNNASSKKSNMESWILSKPQKITPGSKIKLLGMRKYASNTILVVDDEEINRAILSNLLSDSYKIEEAKNGQDALSKLIASPRKYCAVLLDILMEDVDGIQVLKGMQKANLINDIPVFIITANANNKITEKAYDLGAVDVISKPIVPFVVRRRIELITEVYRTRNQLDVQVKDQNLELLKQSEEIIELTRGMIEALSAAIEFRDSDSGDHVHRIYDITRAMLTQTDLGEDMTIEEIDAISLAAIMHDVGKIAIPDSILRKPKSLTSEEYEIMKTHTVQGEKLLASIPQLRSSNVYKYALDITRHHHERWDGKGYPDGLVGKEISIWAQIVALADVYDALTNKRYYKEAYSHDKAIQMISNGECGTFDPELIEKFITVMSTFKASQKD